MPLFFTFFTNFSHYTPLKRIKKLKLEKFLLKTQPVPSAAGFPVQNVLSVFEELLVVAFKRLVSLMFTILSNIDTLFQDANSIHYFLLLCFNALPLTKYHNQFLHKLVHLMKLYFVYN